MKHHQTPQWKTEISITLIEIANFVDYVQNFRAAEGLPFIPVNGTALCLCCGEFKNNFKHIEALKQCISKSSFKYLLL